ncbi:unnamed protein product [Sphagnum troendelagicum]|uniref:PCI domain-containing protein n=1 Tax=Sphagnum troendelagicum TaxID=128251 RepID=A0ABP0U980_9BRYO
MTLLALHQTATLRHDELGQETLLNLLLRKYLHYNLYDQAEKLRSKTLRSDSHSNQQLAGICITWEEFEPFNWNTQMRRNVYCKLPARLCQVPEAVRIGDLELFHAVADKNANVFYTDKTHNLIVRLRHNVIRTGLRNISISYSCISLRDVALKLQLDSATAVADAESTVTKAIWDGGIDASVDHSKGWMKSKATGDIYLTQEPQQAFHSCFAFCLNTHNEAVKALRFPPDARRKSWRVLRSNRSVSNKNWNLQNTSLKKDDEIWAYFSLLVAVYAAFS